MAGLKRSQRQQHGQGQGQGQASKAQTTPNTDGADDSAADAGATRWFLPPGVPKPLSLRVLLLYGGLFLFAVGQVLALKCGLGANSWTVLHDGISQRTPLSIGMATQAMGIVMLIVALVSGVKPGLGTISNMLGVGFYIDALLWLDVAPEMEHWSGGLLMLLLAIVVMGIGSALYIKAGFGAGPRDSFMLVVHRKTGLAIGRVRWLMEVTVVLIGIALGGAFGPGTIVFAMLVGPSVGYFFNYFQVATGETRRVRTVTPATSLAGSD